MSHLKLANQVLLDHYS